MKPDRFFSADDLAALETAARDAEARTSGEIVVYVVGRCGDHEEARWKGATLGALAAVGAVTLMMWWGGPWALGWPWLAGPTIIGAAFGFLLAGWGPACRRLVGGDALDWIVGLRAEAAFLEEEVFDTRERTGVMLFLALFEHRAVVLGDVGINARVAPGEWREIVDGITAGVREKRAAAALIEAIERCGELLEREGVERRDDDDNELSDAPRIRER